MSAITVRELHRNTAAVLALCETDGPVIVRSRSGKEYKLSLVEETPKSKPEWPDFQARARRISKEPLSPELCKLVDAAIRGE